MTESLTLEWHGDLNFRNAPGSPAIELHSSTKGVPSPPQALAYAVMGCMGMDVVAIVRKAHHVVTALRITFSGERAAEHPRRYTSMTLQFTITGDVPVAVVERAIELSRTKYCSVWHTLRPDIELRTALVVIPA